MNKVILLLSICITLISCNKNSPGPSITIYNEVLNPVNSHLFGHFLEKCSWGGEIGGDMIINPKTGEFDSLIMEQLKSLNIPNLRYPGGTDVDYYNWTDLIDNAPGQKSRKPYVTYREENKIIVSDNRLGVNEFLNLCEELKTEPILVLNIGDAFYRKTSIQKAKEQAAGLLAYCNFKSVSEGPDWPSFRKLNGRAQAWKVKYFEIGNEHLGFHGFDWKSDTCDSGLVQHLFNCVRAVADTLLSLDPDLKIIVDGPIQEINKLYETYMKNKIDYLVFHPYAPWGIDKIENRSGEEVDPNLISEEDIWNAWVATPHMDTLTGFSMLFPHNWKHASFHSSFQIALTEWNWNGWLEGKPKKAGLPEPDMAKGIGAAGFLHSFMRMGDKIEMASQSMLVGKSWGITGIRVDREYLQKSVLLPSAQVTGLYSKYHGNKLLKTKYANIPDYPQPYKMNGIPVSPKVAYLDILTTKSEDQIFIHVINRNYKESYMVDTKFEGLELENTFQRFTLMGDVNAEISNKIIKQSAEIFGSEYTINSGSLQLEIPASSVSVFVLELK